MRELNDKKQVLNWLTAVTSTSYARDLPAKPLA
jgi:hypothetical protein